MTSRGTEVQDALDKRKQRPKAPPPPVAAGAAVLKFNTGGRRIQDLLACWRVSQRVRASGAARALRLSGRAGHAALHDHTSLHTPSQS